MPDPESASSGAVFSQVAKVQFIAKLVAAPLLGLSTADAHVCSYITVKASLVEWNMRYVSHELRV